MLKKNYRQLHSFFYPKNIAVIGASNDRHSIPYTLFKNILEGSLAGKCFAVNPFHKEVQGKKSFASIKDIPEKVDLAIIAVPAKIVPKVARECTEKKVNAAIIISAGFAEVGEKQLTQELHEIIDSSKHTRFLGPNCFGVLVPKEKLNTTFSAKERMKLPDSGSVSFMSQSGALGVAILDWMHTQEFGLSKFISYGNAMEIDEADLLEYLHMDKETKVITMYIEGVKEGRKFFETAKKACLEKPVIAFKGGVTEQTHNATASHTGSLAGEMRVYHALFKQTGIIQADSLQELFMFAKIMENCPLPKGKRVAIITNGGGYGIITADQAAKQSLQLAEFSSETKKLLRKKFPGTVNITNPLDLVGDADAKRYSTAIGAALKDRNVDMIMALVLFNTPTINEEVVKEIIKMRSKASKPIVAVSTGSEFTREMLKKFEEGNVVTFEYPEIAAVALRALAEYAQFRREN